MKAILLSLHEGGVGVFIPTADIFRVMQCGGYWNDRPHGFVGAQIERQIQSGIAPNHAKRFARAVAFGGVPEWEVWDIVKDRDTARLGTLHDLIDTDDLPDRYFRNAWSRSANGGPVGIDLNKAKPLQWDYIQRAVKIETNRREESFEELPPLNVPWNTIRSAIKYARDDSELRRIWPDGIERAQP